MAPDMKSPAHHTDARGGFEVILNDIYSMTST